MQQDYVYGIWDMMNTINTFRKKTNNKIYTKVKIM